MNSTQIVIAVGFGTLVLVSLAIAVRIIRSTSPKARRVPADLERIKRNENRYAIGVVVALVALMALTVGAIPYGDTDPEGTQYVRVDAFQFGWTIDPNRVDAGETVVFETRSRDAQHGLGIYRGTELIGQVQVPAKDPNSEAETGDVQRFVHSFDQPGTYEILCLEFCGVQHQNMRATFEVVP